MKSLRWSRWGLLSMCCAASALAAEGDSPKDLFSKLDANKDGQLTLEEVPEDARPHFERLMRKGDKDENKSLSMDEFVAAHTPDAAPEAGRSPEGSGGRGEGRDPGQMFERLDANKDGKLAKSEIPEQAPQQVREMLNRLFEKAGKDELSREEIMQAVGQMAKDRGGNPPGGNPQAGGRGQGGMAQMLKQLDKNGDGQVSKDEFPAEGGERLKGLLERLGGDSIDIKQAEEMAARFGGARPGEGRPEGAGRPESRDGERRAPEGAPRGEGRPEGDRPRGDGPLPEGASRGREGGERGPMPQGVRPPLMDELDENKDGRLSQEEFAKAASKFAALDQNQDGSLDPRELLGPPPFNREGGRDMGPEGRGDRLAGEGDRPRPEGDRPAARGEGDRPRGEGDRPRGAGDRPRPDGEGRGPRPEGDGPRPGADAERGREGGGDRRPDGAPAGAGGRFNPDEFWKQLDKNGDGGISKEEAPERMKANFDTIDANKDGKIDREEGRKAMERGREGRQPGADGPRRPEGDRPEGERRRPEADQPKPEGDKPIDEKPADKPAE